MNTPRILAASIASLVLAATSAYAQTWDGAGVVGGSFLWNLGTNWSPDGVPVNNGTANIAFGGAIDLSPDMDVNFSVASLAFNNGAGAFTLGSTGGFTLSLGAGGIAHNDDSTQTINTAIALSAAQNWNVNSTGALTVNGGINNGGNLLTVNTANGNATLSGIINGSGGLTKAGGGTLTISGAGGNSYSGVTTVNGGTLILQKTAGLSAIAGNVVVGDGTGTDTLQLGASNQIPNSSNVTVNSSGVFDLANFSDSFLVLNVNGGSVAIGTGSLTLGTSLTMTGGNIASTGAGQLTLSGNLITNAAANAATISGSFLNLGGSVRSFTVADGAASNDLEVTATITNGGINKLGAGTLRLMGNGTFAGGLNVTAGTVFLGFSSSAGTNTVALSGGTIASDGTVFLSNAITFNANSSAENINFGSAVTLVGDRTLTVNAGIVSMFGPISGDLTTNTFTKTGPGALTFESSSPNTYTGVTTVNEGTLRLGSSSTAIAGNLVIGDGIGGDAVQIGNFSEQIANTSSVTINSGGVLTFFGFIPTTETIDALIVNAGGFAEWNGTFAVSSLQLTGDAFVTAEVGSTLLLNGNVTTVPAGGNQSTITAFTNLGGGARTFTIGDGAAQVDASLAALTNGTLIKEGAGGLLLTGGASNLSVTLNAGLLVAGASNSLGSGVLTLNGGTIMANVGFLTFPNAIVVGGSGNVTFGGTAFTTYGGPITFGTAAQTLTFSSSALTVFSGAIGQSVPNAAFTKLGSATLRFEGSGSNTYNGATIVSNGTLLLNKSGGATAIAGDLVVGDGVGSDVVQILQNQQIADTSSVTVNTGATFDLGSSTETIHALSVGLNASVNVSGGTLVIGSGGLQIDGGAIFGNGSLSLLGDVLSTSANVGIGAVFPSVDLAGGTRTFNIQNGAGDFELDILGSMSDGTLVKTGDGVLRFSGTVNNISSLSVVVNEGELRLQKTETDGTITGSLTIGDGIGGANADVVRLAAPEQIASTAATQITINSSGLLDTAGFVETIGNLTLVGGRITTGAGFVNLAAGPNINLTARASSVTASISGNLFLSNQTKRFTIESGGLAVDLDITAQVGAGGIIKEGEGVLRLGGANTISQGLTINDGRVLLGHNSAAGSSTIVLAGGAMSADGNSRTLANAVNVTGPALIDGAQDLTLNGTFSVTETGDLTKSGTGTLTIGSSPSVLDGALTLSQGTLVFVDTKTLSPTASFTQEPGTTFNGAIINQGTFTFNGGTFNGSLQNDGALFVNGGFNAANGFTNFTTVSVDIGGSLSANASGLVNEGVLVLTGGVLQSTGTGTVVNNGEIIGFGSIVGSVGFTNNAQLTIGGGNLTLANTGGQNNVGNIDVTSGRQLRLNQPLANTGTIVLDGGTIGSPAALSNNAGGTVSGRGTISAPITNSGGTIRAEGGTLNITNTFTNSGIVRVEDGGGLSGGTIINSGRIQGDGSITNAITNNGRIEAVGTLALGGAVTQGATGVIAAGVGSTVFVTGGLSGNAGAISLTGGTFDNNGFPLNNTGQISGFGVIATGGAGLANNGSVIFTGGFSTINGDVTNAPTKTIETVGVTTLFTGNVVNNGIFKNTDGRFVFTGAYTENGLFVSDPADNFFNDLAVGPNGAMAGGVGDRFFVRGDFLNGSLQSGAWQTNQGELIFHGGTTSAFSLAGADLGQTYSGFSNNFAWGTLRLEIGQSLTLGDGNGSAGAALYVSIVDLDGGLAQLGAITGNGFNIYYDPANTANAYLGNQIHQFTGGGALVPVPEPSAFCVLLAGVVGLAARRRRAG